MMLSFSGTDANRAIVAFFGTQATSLPDHTREKLIDAVAGTDLASTVITTMEALYAARADLDSEGIELLDGLARFVSDKGFHGKGLRAALIAGVTARIADGGAAEAEGDPEIDRQMLAPEEQPERADGPSEHVLALASGPVPPVEVEGGKA